MQPYEALAIAMPVPAIDPMRAVLAHIDAEIAAGRAVYVHCHGGIGRTGSVAGCRMIENDELSGAQTLRGIAELRSDKANTWWRSPETDEQRRFVERLAAPR